MSLTTRLHELLGSVQFSEVTFTIMALMGVVIVFALWSVPISMLVRIIVVTFASAGILTTYVVEDQVMRYIHNHATDRSLAYYSAVEGFRYAPPPLLPISLVIATAATLALAAILVIMVITKMTRRGWRVPAAFGAATGMLAAVSMMGQVLYYHLPIASEPAAIAWFTWLYVRDFAAVAMALFIISVLVACTRMLRSSEDTTDAPVEPQGYAVPVVIKSGNDEQWRREPQQT